MALRSGEIAYAPSYSASLGSYKLLELDKELLAHVEAGGSMFLKGQGEDALVLTTHDASYSVQLVETSNTVLPAHVPDAAADSNMALVIEGCVGGVIQVNRIVPSWGRLRSILARHVYAGEDNDVAADAELADEDIAVVDDAVDERHDDDVAVDEAADVTVKEVHDDSMDAAEGYSAAFPVGEASLIAAAGGMSQLAAAYGDEQFTKTQPVQPVLDLVDNDSDLDADDDATAVRSASSMTRTTAGKRRRTGGRSVRRGVTLRALLASVLSSEAELRAALDREGALELPRGSGRYRAVDPDFNLAVLDAALMEASAAAAEDGRLSADGGSGAPSWLVDMDTAAIAARLQDRFPVDVTRHVLRTFSVDRSRKSEVEGPEDARATLSFNAVARAKALQLLRQRDTGNGVAMDSFMAAWHRSLGRDVLRLAPADAVARSSMAQSAIASILAGYVLVDDAAGTGGALGRAASQPAVRMFNHELLPEDAAARFKTLFAVRPRWRLDDIAPFIAPIAGPGRSQDELVLAHSRATLLPDGSRIFSERR